MSHQWLSISLGVKAQVLPPGTQGPLCSGPKLSHLTLSLLTLLALAHMDPDKLDTIMVFRHSRHAPTLQALFSVSFPETALEADACLAHSFTCSF